MTRSVLPRGKNHWHWNGGRKNNNGYVMIYKPNHPNCDQQGYVREHRLVMEQYLKRYLRKDEIIHHLNHKKNDNRIKNLTIFTKKEHDKIHLASGINTRFKKGQKPWNIGKKLTYDVWNKGTKKTCTKSCLTCEQEFVIPLHREDKAKYCSRKCQPIWNKGLKGLQPWHNLKGLRYMQ